MGGFVPGVAQSEDEPRRQVRIEEDLMPAERSAPRVRFTTAAALGDTMTTPTARRWQVTSDTSVYLLDLHARQVAPVPDAGAGNPGGVPPSVPACFTAISNPCRRSTSLAAR